MTGDTGTCRASVDDCQDEALTCDEAADCALGSCCAETSTRNQFRFSAYCRPTCITGLPRVEVCSESSECPSGSCKEWSCGGYRMNGVETCAPLGPCD